MRKILRVPKHFNNTVEQNPHSTFRPNPPKGWSHATTPHSCVHCAQIALRHPGVEILEQRQPFTLKLPYTNAEAVQAAADGCPLFAAVCDTIKNALRKSPKRKIGKIIKLDQLDTYYAPERMPCRNPETTPYHHFRRIFSELRKKNICLNFYWCRQDEGYEVCIGEKRYDFTYRVKALPGEFAVIAQLPIIGDNKKHHTM